MNGNTNKRRDLDMIVYIFQREIQSDKGNERNPQIPKELSDRRWIKTYLRDSSEQNYIYFVKVTGKSIWA